MHENTKCIQYTELTEIVRENIISYKEIQCLSHENPHKYIQNGKPELAFCAVNIFVESILIYWLLKLTYWIARVPNFRQKL